MNQPSHSRASQDLTAQNRARLTGDIKHSAQQLGFDLVAVCPALTPTGLSHFHDWLDAGMHGQMHYLSDRRDAYSHPRHVMDGARSLVVLGTHYRTADPALTVAGQGRVSRYAWGTTDYHDLIHDRLKSLKKTVAALFQETDEKKSDSLRANVRGVVDTAPLLEREFAQLAGIGWQGKNTMLISPTAGSYFFLSCLLVDFELDYDQPHVTDHCGSCTACMDACPTDAFPQPRVLDATRCISYLTIELRDAIPSELRGPMGDWIFGCDICQEVCPWNRFAPATNEQSFDPAADGNPMELLSLFDLDDEAFRARFRRTPLWRSRRRGILRNAAIVLGNQVDTAALPALVKGLNDLEPLVRGASAWAIGRIATKNATVAETCRDGLVQRRASEVDQYVAGEIDAAIGETV